jgi:protein-disulfide isomerase
MAAGAARMAKDKGKFKEMTDWLYANQGTTHAALKQAVTNILGISAADFDKEYALKLPEIKRDIADGGVLKVSSTPTYIINGVMLPSGLIPPQYFELAISLELKGTSE